MVPAIVHNVSEELPVPPQPRPWLLMAACWRLLLVAPSGATAYMDFSRPEIEFMCNMPFRWFLWNKAPRGSSIATVYRAQPYGAEPFFAWAGEPTVPGSTWAWPRFGASAATAATEHGGNRSGTDKKAAVPLNVASASSDNLTAGNAELPGQLLLPWTPSTLKPKPVAASRPLGWVAAGCRFVAGIAGDSHKCSTQQQCDCSDSEPKADASPASRNGGDKLVKS
ncbi:hypothetical protein PCL_00189 [Purpureocillium lilacinum]|uniref:Uncharacterized protein n=1 Tax=Purpureocillium lilacinum TaxID=33203 RepID=A0A2U3E696_PURLI|nr:hypothetical protein Purlil1_11383 [Purpureocillium lilacinum]PWI70045.1 hypothetical protein PCL_00189 [Purpureocillium lilacinum]